MSRRVVITGMGVLSPNGIGKQAFCRAVLAGQSGVGHITHFQVDGLPVHIAGEVRGFDELAWMDPLERKHVSRVVPLAIAASSEALADAGLDPATMSMEEKRRIGVVLGTGGGAQDFSEAQYRLWLEGNVKQVSLYSIPSGTMGTLSSEVNMKFGFRGLSHVVTSGCTSSTDALGYARRQIQAGALPMILAATPAAPQAPWGCPICDFSADMGVRSACLPSASFSALVSMRSLSWVEVPCRLTYCTFSGAMPASSMAIWMARAGSSPNSASRTRWKASQVEP